MFKKLGLALFCASTLFSINCEAATEVYSSPSTYKTQLTPEKPDVFTNYLFRTITATCNIETEDAKNIIEVEGINLSGSVNNIPVTKGTHLNIEVHNNDLLVITAKSAAQVKLTNHGEHTIFVNCTY